MSWPVKIIRWSFYLLFFFVPLIFLPNTSELFEFNKMIAVYLITAVIAGSWVIEMVLRKRIIFRRTPLDWPLIVFLISYLISLLFSIDLRTSLLGYYSRFNGGFVSLLCYSVLYWAFVTFMDRKSSLTTIYWLLTTAFLVCLYGILQHFGIDDQIWVQDVKNRVFSTLGQPNWLAAYLVALIFIPISYLTSNPSPEFRRGGSKGVRYWLVFILFFITLLFSKSRSGLLAFGISSVVYWGFTLFQNITPHPPLKLRGGIKEGVIKQFLIFIFLTLTLTLTISNPLRDQYLLRLANREAAPSIASAKEGPALETGGTESGTIRKIVWTGAIRIWQSSAKTFWLGSGPETFAMAYYQHRPIEHNATSEWELLYNKAHNEFLNYLATTGILGLGSYLILLGSMLYVLINSKLKIQRSEPNSKVQNLNSEFYILNSALFAGWLTIPVTNFWGFSVVIVNLLLFLLPALALALNQPVNDIPPPPLRLRTWQVLAFLFCLLATGYCLLATFKYWLADVDYASGQKSLKSFTATQEPAYILSSYNSYLAAYELNKADPPIASDLATVMAYMALLTSESDSTTSAELTATALALSESAVTASPYHPNYYKSRSRTAIILSTIDPKYLDVANQALKSARAISPTDPRLLYNLAIVARYQEDFAAAKNYLAAALALKPDFADALAEQAELASASAKIGQ